jgi:uncharacterized membrane protein
MAVSLIVAVALSATTLLLHEAKNKQSAAALNATILIL